jgi:hypothetical protein
METVAKSAEIKNPHEGRTWDEVAQNLTPEERAASALRVAIMTECSDEERT